MYEDLAPIALFVYNHPHHTEKTVDALLNNELASQSNCYIFSDAAKSAEDEPDVQAVRAYIKSIAGFRSVKVLERDKNMGMTQPLKTGVSEILNCHEKIIVLEDDDETSPFFIKYMNESLNYYSKNNRVSFICGYSPPQLFRQYKNINNDDIYFNSKFKAWGWGTWLNRWQAIDWRIKSYYSVILNPFKIRVLNCSSYQTCMQLRKYVRKEKQGWSIALSYTNLKSNSVCVYPMHSHVNNIGHDGSGVNCGITEMFYNDLKLAMPTHTLPSNITIDKNIMKTFKTSHAISIKDKVILILKIYINGAILFRIMKAVKQILRMN